MTPEQEAAARSALEADEQIRRLLSTQNAAVTGVKAMQWEAEHSTIGALLDVGLTAPITIAEEHPEISRRPPYGPGYRIEVSNVRSDNVDGLWVWVDFTLGKVVAFEPAPHPSVRTTYPPGYIPPPPGPD